MKEITLTQGKVALVDDEDFDFLNQWKWYAHKCRHDIYATMHIGRKHIIRMHTMIINPGPGLHIDHVNHNGLDNRRVNLRIVSHRENQLNLKKTIKNKYPGVQKNYSRYVAKIRINSKNIYLGTFDTPELARDAYLNKLNEVSLLNAPMPEL